MYTLYGSRGSGSAAIEAALVLAGLPFREVRASTWEADSAQGELQRQNLLGQIPTLVTPEGQVLTESAAILLHVGRAHPASALLPAAQAQSDQVVLGLVYVAANCYAAIGVIDYPERWSEAVPGDEPATQALHDSIRRGTRARLHSLWNAFADQFPATPYLSGAAPGALDLLAAVVSRWAGGRPHLLAARPALAEALSLTDRHPVLEPVFARHWPAVSA